MKPIRLKIKGLNSFTDSQEVNFEKLTDKGLFGIFGPTGSGKSTILDGITLALYGDVARKSTNYINTNHNTLNVSFEFQISDKEVKRYRIDREFKRDNKTDSVRSRAAKIIDVTAEPEVILEEGANSVNKKCEEIIGLKLEDFTRTVVLPQGKFSEFLKLEGKEKRTMLERLFNLQKYGDELSIKLNNKIREEKQKSNILHGELKGYEDINEELFKEKISELEETKVQYEKTKTDLKSAEKAFDEGKILWDLQAELERYSCKLRELKQKEENIKEGEKKVNLGNSSLRVKPYLDNYEKTLEEILDLSDKTKSLRNKLEELKENRQKAENNLNEAKNKKDIEQPKLDKKRQEVDEAIQEKNELDTLLSEISALDKSINDAEGSLNEISKTLQSNKESSMSVIYDINLKEEKIETLKVSDEYKNKISTGIVTLNSYNDLIEQKSKASCNITDTLKNINEAKEKSSALKSKLEEVEKLLVQNTDALNSLGENNPGDQDTLLKLQKELTDITNKWSKFNEYELDISKSKARIEILQVQLNDRKTEKVSLEQELASVEEKAKKLQIENLAHSLRESLIEGEACPVCGSKEHNIENIKIEKLIDLEQAKLQLSGLEKKKNKLSEGIIQDQTSIEAEQTNITQKQVKINELGEEFKIYSLDLLTTQFEELQINIEKYKKDKADLDKKEKTLIKQKNDLEISYNKELTKLTQNEELLEKFQGDFKEIEKKLIELENKLKELKAELNIEDIELENKEIIRKDKEKDSLEKEIRGLRKQLKENEEQKEVLIKDENRLKEKCVSEKATLTEKLKAAEEKQKRIYNKVGEASDLEALRKNLSETIEKIESSFKLAEKAMKEAGDSFNECNNDIIALEANITSSRERSISDKKKLEEALIEEGFSHIEDAKENYLSKEEIDFLKNEIDDYKNSCTSLSGAIENIKSKIGNRSLSEVQWIEIQTVKSDKNEAIKKLEELKIKLETEVNNISKRLETLKILLEKKEKLDYKLGLLDDLDKLFKGKKFVEFVAANQLKYVSIEACKRLKEITGGNYGLEVDENGKFLIRDYKNGGAQRDASTLSGGETFVVSLALALALSAQIQLKGTAPLELFFLDEGFGTLDDNLIEVVMDSLEKIHNDRLSIGIISHVEAIKNRVPVKLIVTAAEAGMCGSKVKIERS